MLYQSRTDKDSNRGEQCQAEGVLSPGTARTPSSVWPVLLRFILHGFKAEKRGEGRDPEELTQVSAGRQLSHEAKVQTVSGMESPCPSWDGIFSRSSLFTTEVETLWEEGVSLKTSGDVESPAPGC